MAADDAAAGGERTARNLATMGPPVSEPLAIRVARVAKRSINFRTNAFVFESTKTSTTICSV